MFTFGTDPECFFTIGDGKVLPAGVVFDQLSVNHTYRTEYGNLYVDGAALELQPKPSSQIPNVIANLEGLFQESVILAEYAGVEIAVIPEMPIDLTWCKKDPGLAVFGCDPDQSVWGEECRPATIDASKHPWRYAGCHLHFGIDSSFFRDKINIYTTTRALDRTVGLASMVLGDGHDARRRGIYGRPGIYRIQPWGIEYRTPSNAILQTPELMTFAFEVSNSVLDLVVGNHYEKMVEVIPDDLVVSVLRGSDIESARTLYGLMATAFDLPILPPVFEGNWRAKWLS